VWQIYYNNGICCKSPDGAEEVLFKDGLEDFDVTADSNENIYILCQDNKNYFYLYWYDGEKWQNKCMLESSATEVYNKNFTLLNVNDWLNAFYTVKHQNDTLIVHHIIYSESEPEIIERNDNFKCYFSACDSYGDIYCFFVRDKELGYKKYSWKDKNWSNYKGIFKFNEEVHNICVAFDKNNNYHITCCIGEEGKYKVVYLNKNSICEIIGGGFSEIKPVVVISDKIHILFDFAGRVLQAISENGGNSFVDAKYFFPGSFNRQGVVKIVSASENRGEIKVTYTYGYETNYGKLVPSLAENIKNIEKSTEITEIKPEIEQFAPDNAKITPPEQYKQENDTDVLFKMIKVLSERIDALENCLNDNRQINIVNQKNEA
jgi:hypothetical protein